MNPPHDLDLDPYTMLLLPWVLHLPCSTLTSYSFPCSKLLWWNDSNSKNAPKKVCCYVFWCWLCQKWAESYSVSAKFAYGWTFQFKSLNRLIAVSLSLTYFSNSFSHCFINLILLVSALFNFHVLLSSLKSQSWIIDVWSEPCHDLSSSASLSPPPPPPPVFLWLALKLHQVVFCCFTVVVAQSEIHPEPQCGFQKWTKCRKDHPLRQLTSFWCI